MGLNDLSFQQGKSKSSLHSIRDTPLGGGNTELEKKGKERVAHRVHLHHTAEIPT